MLKPRGSVYVQAALGRRSSGWTASRARTSPRAWSARRPRPSRSPTVAVPGVLLPRRGAGRDERRARQRRPGAPARAHARRSGDAVRASRRRSRTGCRRRICRRCARPGCSSRATTRSAGSVTAAIDGATAGRRVLAGDAVAVNVRVNGATIKVIGASGESDDLAGVATLAAGSWTPSGAAALGVLGGGARRARAVDRRRRGRVRAAVRQRVPAAGARRFAALAGLRERGRERRGWCAGRTRCSATRLGATRAVT